MKKVFLAMNLLWLQSFEVQANEMYNNAVYSCAELGYDVSLSECKEKMRDILGDEQYHKFMPLHCPYDYDLVKCWYDNCGGYALTEKDTKFEYEECLAGYANGDFVKYYRPKSCKGKDEVMYRYDNGICIERCDETKYPFLSSPGSLAGSVESCYDDVMHYGYLECNEGFGELVNGYYFPKDGRCDMMICDINTYPFLEKPDENRGKFEVCAGGSNKYYRYESCYEGYEKLDISNGNCVKRFALENGNFDGVKIGDVLTYNNTIIGTFFHLPEAEDNRYLIISHKENALVYSFATVVQSIPGLPELSLLDKSKDKDGKTNTYYLVNDPNDNHPAAEYCYNYAPAVCENSELCGKTVWFFHACMELYYMYQNKYILQNSLPSTYALDNGYFASRGAYGVSSIVFQISNGKFSGNIRTVSGYSVRPIMQIIPE